MKGYTDYYVVDPIMENIVGSYSAPNDEAAKKIFQDSVLKNDKFKSYGNSLKVFCTDVSTIKYETLKEIEQYCREEKTFYDTAD